MAAAMLDRVPRSARPARLGLLVLLAACGGGGGAPGAPDADPGVDPDAAELDAAPDDGEPGYPTARAGRILLLEQEYGGGVYAALDDGPPALEELVVAREG